MGNVMAKELVKLLFIKSNGAFIGQLTDETDTSVLDLSSFIVKDVDLDVDNGDFWYGDCFTGEVRSRAEKPVVTESFLRYKTNLNILKDYPVHAQLNILIDMIDANSSVKTAEFEEFKVFLKQMRDTHNEKIAYYSSNPEIYTWMSQEEEDAINEAKSTGL